MPTGITAFLLQKSLSKISRGFENRTILEELDSNTVVSRQIGDLGALKLYMVSSFGNHNNRIECILRQIKMRSYDHIFIDLLGSMSII